MSMYKGGSGAMREVAKNIDAAAAEWVTRMDRGLSASEREALERWLIEDTRCSGALARAQAVWIHCDRARVYRDGNTLESTATQGEMLPSGEPVRARSWKGWTYSSAAILLVGTLGIVLSWNAHAYRHISTTIGEVRAVPLEDGSRLMLDTASGVAVHFERSMRVVQLESGVASFAVSKDVTRPFVVFAGHTRVRAIGTAFMVRLHSDESVEVTVTQGAVDVWRDNSGPEPAVRLKAGDHTVSTSTQVEPPQALTGQQLEGEMAWEEGVIDLRSRSLAEAANEFNRYNHTVVVINDAKLAQQTVVGRFQADNPVAFVNAAAAMLGAKVRKQDNRLILEPAKND